jgi:hypothetical protein
MILPDNFCDHLRHLRCGQSRLGQGDGKGRDEIRGSVAEVYDSSQYQRRAEGLLDVCEGEMNSFLTSQSCRLTILSK